MSLEDYRYYDEKDIENITNFHRQRTEDRKGGFEKVYIVYNLKNGKTLKRIYYASLIDDKKYLEPIFTTEQKIKLNHNWLVGEYPVAEITISDDRLKNDTKTFEILVGDSEKAKLLLDALKKDINEAGYEDIVAYANSRTQVQVAYQRPLMNEDGKILFEDKSRLAYDNFGIPKSYVRTTALLEEWGLFDAIYKPTELSCVELEFDYRQDEKIIFKNPDEIKELYEFFSDAKFIDKGGYGYDFNAQLIFINADGQRIFDISGFGQTNIPVPEIVDSKIKDYISKHGHDTSNVIAAETYETY